MHEIISQWIIMAKDIIYQIRIQNYHQGSLLFKEMLAQMQEYTDIVKELLDIINVLTSSLEKGDEILFADVLEEGFIPRCQVLLSEYLEQTDVNSEYVIESTISGLPTVKHLHSDLYLHSNNYPMEEARYLVEKCYDSFFLEYVIWGSGLGYHVYQLYQYTRGAISIKVFEESEELLDLAFNKGVLGKVPRDVLSCEVDPDGRKFSTYIHTHKVGLLLHFPSINKIQDSKLKKTFLSFFSSWNGTIQYKTELTINYQKNIKNCVHFVDELSNVFQNNSIIIVGGGPSLDEHIEFLQKNKENRKIVAVSTVWKRLEKYGIEPDMYFVMDSQLRTFKHMEGVKTDNIPLVIDSTACWKFAEYYKGKSYLACQNGYREAELLAKRNQLHLFNTGGTVVSLALDVALQLGAKEILFLGVDLAYPGGKSHADGTMDCRNRDTRLLMEVRAQDGTTTYTDEQFTMYRKWIEEEIAVYPSVSFWNMASKGAYIEGTKQYK